MKVIKRAKITGGNAALWSSYGEAPEGTIITSTNVGTGPYSDWSSSTTYAINQKVRMLTYVLASVTLSIASPCVVTKTAHGLSDGMSIIFTTTGALPTGIVANQIYFIRASDANTFNISLGLDDNYINTSGTQSGTHGITAFVNNNYISLQNGNINKNPIAPGSSSWWYPLGAVNAYRMFDDSPSTVSSRNSPITVVLTSPNGNTDDTLALLNLTANQATVTVTVNGVTIYSVTKNTAITDSLIGDGLTVRKKTLLFDGIPWQSLANDRVITITINASGKTVSCGALVWGRSINIGDSKYGLGLGMIDYSIKSADEFGNTTFIPRRFIKTNSIDVWIENAKLDQVFNFLASFRAIPTLYIGSDSYETTFIYGYFKDFNINLEMPLQSSCSITIEGII